MFRKAQAAMEFLMTYGWALLAVLVVIGALAYLGVLDVEILLPERCTFAVPLNCDDQVVEGDKLQIVLLNGGGEGIRVRSIIAESEAFKTESSGSANNYKCVWTPVSSGASGSTHTGYHLLRNGESQTFALKWSVPADTTFSLDSTTADGVYKSAGVDRDIIVGNNADPVVYHMSSQVATNVLTITGNTDIANNEAAAPKTYRSTAITAAGAITIQGGEVTTATPNPAGNDPDANCFYNDLGRRKNRYSVTVHYTLADSTLPHKITGEVFSSSP